MKVFFPSIFIFLTLFCTHSHAQDATLAQQFLGQIKTKNPKTVVTVFDISKSMAYQFKGKPAPALDQARPFAQDLVNDALRKGDRIVMYAFDKKPLKTLDTVFSDNLPTILDTIPKISTLSSVQGTNIRWAHYEGLKILEQEAAKKRPAYLVILSDGYHDSPDSSDPNYTTFYLPSRLDKLPDNAKAREYLQLAKRFRSQSFGVGLQIDPNGMIVEAAPEANPTPNTQTTTEPLESGEPIPEPVPFHVQYRTELIIGATALTAGLLGFAIWSSLFKPIRVGLGQPNDPRRNKLFAMPHGGRITLGGVGAAALPNAFEVPSTKAAVGYIVRKGQKFILQPATNPPDGTFLTVNGQPLTGQQALSFGDQIRVKFSNGERDHLFTWNQASAFKTLLNR